MAAPLANLARALRKKVPQATVKARASTGSHAKMITVEEAKKMPRSYCEMPNDILLMMAVMGDQDAREERLIREIMAVDLVSWEEAQPTFRAIVDYNRKGLMITTLPYKVGLASALVAAVVAFPMVFDINTVLAFNQFYVTADVPEPKDLETALEVGSFAWNWMEPPLGTVSFFLLCCSFARAQLENLGIKPYTSSLKHRRADRLIKNFPKYNPSVLRSFSEGDPLSGRAVDKTR
eukprot:RCo030314